jgi:hypothetical protein
MNDSFLIYLNAYNGAVITSMMVARKIMNDNLLLMKNMIKRK